MFFVFIVMFCDSQVDGILSLISPLVQDQSDEPAEEEDPEDFAEEQGIMGRFIHMLRADDCDQQYLVRETSLSHYL